MLIRAQIHDGPFGQLPVFSSDFAEDAMVLLRELRSAISYSVIEIGAKWRRVVLIHKLHLKSILLS